MNSGLDPTVGFSCCCVNHHTSMCVNLRYIFLRRITSCHTLSSCVRKCIICKSAFVLHPFVLRLVLLERPLPICTTSQFAHFHFPCNALQLPASYYAKLLFRTGISFFLYAYLGRETRARYTCLNSLSSVFYLPVLA